MTETRKTSLDSELIRVPTGRFRMGACGKDSPRGRHEREIDVEFNTEFYLGQTLVTQKQYKELIGKNPSFHTRYGEQAPVDRVNWGLAVEFCQKLTEKDRALGLLPEDWAYRLPSESEWEYACLANETFPTNFQLSDYAWHDDNADRTTHPVGSKKANSWGFQDMLGNLFEWCREWYHSEFSPENTQPPTQIPEDYRTRVVRGGCWYNSGLACQPSFREAFNPAYNSAYIGFRLALSAKDFSIEIEDTSKGDPPPRPTIEQQLYKCVDKNNLTEAERLLSDHSGLADYHDEVPPILHWAVIHNKRDMVDLLLKYGAQIERYDQDENSTALGYAVVYARAEIVKLLIEHGANREGMLDRALKGAEGGFEVYDLPREQYPEIVELLRSYETT